MSRKAGKISSKKAGGTKQKTRGDARKHGAQNSVGKKPRGKGRPFEVGNQYRFPKGVSGNPGGRPKLLSDAYKDWLALVDKKSGLTHAQLVVQAQGQRAIIGHDTTAAKEIRSATEVARVEVTGEGGKPLIPTDAKELTDEQLAAIAAGGIATAGGDRVIETPPSAS